MKYINPFNQLYVTERIAEDTFVELFSPVVVPHISSLFQRGNVVLKGSQGTGKSMLLSLLSPKTLLAYKKKEVPFCAPSAHKFIGAEINLSQCGILEIGQRRIPGGDDDSLLYARVFADYFNFWVIKEIIASVKLIGINSAFFDDYVNVRNFDDFAKNLAQKDCWSNYLDGISSLDFLEQKIKKRLLDYYAFHQFNIDEFPKDIMETKTSINEPIKETILSLIETNVISPETLILINIDQYETLNGCIVATKEIGEIYKQTIHKALGSRDPVVSYKIGTRPYGWNVNELTLLGSRNKIEEGRDYTTIDLGEMFRKNENSKSWLFARFAEDVFERRIKYYLCENESSSSASNRKGERKSQLDIFLGKGYTDFELAKSQYAGRSEASSVFKFPEKMPTAWRNLITTTFSGDPLKAKLMFAWMMQKSHRKTLNYQSGITLSEIKEREPWEKVYWKKERIRQALMQLASACRQRMLWAGKDNVIMLCANSILVFLSLCQHIWDTNYRAKSYTSKNKLDSEDDPYLLKTIENVIQSLAIESTSKQWYEKILEHPEGNNRQRFIAKLGTFFRSGLLCDIPMSYPGANGFSLDETAFLQNEKVKRFLYDAVDYEALIVFPHTTKSSDKKKRLKFYLNTILSPYLQLPEARQKEPLYIQVSDVESWIDNATEKNTEFSLSCKIATKIPADVIQTEFGF